jgi:hypothetical protein
VQKESPYSNLLPHQKLGFKVSLHNMQNPCEENRLPSDGGTGRWEHLRTFFAISFLAVVKKQKIFAASSELELY